MIAVFPAPFFRRRRLPDGGRVTGGGADRARDFRREPGGHHRVQPGGPGDREQRRQGGSDRPARRRHDGRLEERCAALKLSMADNSGLDQVYLDESLLAALQEDLAGIESGIPELENGSAPYRVQGTASCWRPAHPQRILCPSYRVGPDWSGMTLAPADRTDSNSRRTARPNSRHSSSARSRRSRRPESGYFRMDISIRYLRKRMKGFQTPLQAAPGAAFGLDRGPVRPVRPPPCTPAARH